MPELKCNMVLDKTPVAGAFVYRMLGQRRKVRLELMGFADPGLTSWATIVPSCGLVRGSGARLQAVPLQSVTCRRDLRTCGKQARRSITEVRGEDCCVFDGSTQCVGQ